MVLINCCINPGNCGYPEHRACDRIVSLEKTIRDLLIVADPDSGGELSSFYINKIVKRAKDTLEEVY